MGVVRKSTFDNKFSEGIYKERHYHKTWFDVVCHTRKCELRLWLKANLDSHTVKHQESKYKKLLKRKKKF
jgi:hypothetical protein